MDRESERHGGQKIVTGSTHRLSAATGTWGLLVDLGCLCCHPPPPLAIQPDVFPVLVAVLDGEKWEGRGEGRGV